MSIDKFHTIKELKNTGLPMFNAHVSADTKIGEYYLQPVVISMWDWEDYGDSFTYFDGSIQKVVHLCHKVSETHTKFERLKKDLSNLPNNQ